MSYINRFGGGQIFPQNQQLQQNAQRQMQMMQMQLQLQQKIQSQLQKQYTIKTEAQKRNIEPDTQEQPKNVPAGKGPGQNQPNNANQKPVQQAKPNTLNQGQAANQKNMNNVDNKIHNQGQNKPQGIKGPDNVNKPNINAGVKVELKENPAKDKPNADLSNDRGPKNKPPFQNQKGQQSQTRPQNSLLGQHPSERLGPPVNDVKSERNPAPLGGQIQRSQQGPNQYNKPNQGQGSWQGGHNQDSEKLQGQQDSGRYQGQNQNSGKFQGQNQNSGKFQGQNQNQGSGNYQQQQNYNRGNPQRNALESSKFGGGKPSNQNSNDYRQVPPSRGAPQGKVQARLSYFGMEQVKNKLRNFIEPLVDLEELDMAEKKFNAYAKLFIGNIPKNCEQKEITSLFEKYGEIGPVYLNKESSFGFIHMDYKASAAKAMKELDNISVKNRHLKIRFATINEGLRVKNLSPYVSNELLERCFSVFGPIESCRVVVDDRGNAKQEGIVIFKDKKSCLIAIRKCQDECYFLSGAMRPVVVLALEPSEDNVDGYPEALLPKNDEYTSERNILPHFAEKSSFEFEFGMQWKQLFAMYEEKKATLDRDFQIELERLEKKMVLAKVEYETDKLRKELAQREAESAELRRHFDFNDPMGPPPSGPASGGYDSYSGTKRPLDEGYDSTYKGPYEGSYPDGYSRGGAAYTSADYDRSYDQGGYGSYGRDDYREGSGPVAAVATGDPGYGHERGYENTYDRTNDLSVPSRSYEGAAPEGYASNPDGGPGGDLYAGGPSKRPRY